MILLTSFKNYSKRLMNLFDENYDKLVFSDTRNNCVKQFESKPLKDYDLVVMFGVKSAIKNIVLESTANENGINLQTELGLSGMPFRVNNGLPNCPCNFVYFKALALNKKALFIHIPSAKKQAIETTKQQVEIVIDALKC